MWLCCISTPVVKISLTGCRGLWGMWSLNIDLRFSHKVAGGHCRLQAVDTSEDYYVALYSWCALESHRLRFRLVLFQTTISGPTVKNNSLHGNIPLVKVDAATSVWLVEMKKSVCWLFLLYGDCCMFVHVCLFSDEPLDYADSFNLSLSHPFREHPFILDLQRHPAIATILQHVSHFWFA